MTELGDMIRKLELTDWYDKAPPEVQRYLRELITEEVDEEDKYAFVEGFLHGSHKATEFTENLIPDLTAPWKHKELRGKLFMSIFRNDEFQSLITNDDKIEVFLGVLAGESDLSLDLIKQLYEEYGSEFVVCDRCLLHRRGDDENE